ncbi:hypothetical protein N7489_004442 [Penicillium chrysogenum]|uniref:uncharacterized protein n=1 Tax=Penicillium chrysogenum TaxID=5076 RepID=UPI0024DF17DE|nr:uncharacterized protein N7489_004442 [Penicillium chrysogenum]KAJ5244346.1 hypothetical protein N7489_004442 [Penicillium chrysogenum]
MSLSPLGEAPVGTDLSADHGSLEKGPVIATYILAVLAVGLRFYTRLRVQGQRIAADDWMIVGALLYTAGRNLLFRSDSGCGHHGLGRHIWSVPPAEAVELMRVLFAFVVLYVLTIPLIKLSVLLFYRRIFGMTYPIWFCVFLTIGYFLSGTIAFLACCRPVSYFWTQFAERSGGKCVFNLYPFYVSHAAINVATDGIILLVPIPIVWKLQMRDVLSRHAKGHNQANATAGPSEAPNRQSAVIAVASSIIPEAGNGATSAESQIPVSTISQDAPLALTGLPSSLEYLADISAHHGRTETDLGVMMFDDQQHDFGWNAATPADHMSHQAGVAFDPGPKDMLKMWLEPCTDSASNDSLDLMGDSNFPLMGDNSMITPDQQNRRSVDSSDKIPNERFTRVQQCWLAPPNTGRLINSLWRDIAMSPVDNIFSVQSLHLHNEPSIIQGSRCGFDEDCKQRLQAAFGQMTVSAYMESPSNRNIPPATPTSTLNHSDFPPAEIFDMALDLFFRLFNPLLPFVHLPTFSAKKTRPSLLYVMTLVGMTLLGTKGTTAFVSRNFSSALNKVTAEFSRCSMGLESVSGTVTSFATVLLLINLAGLTGEKTHLEQCQPLYINVMSVAQRHGLFSANEGQVLDMTLFETVPDIDMRWKAWSKVESTKRIIIGLLLLDSWYSSFLSTGPIAVPDSIQLILPCSESLFSAHSSIQWAHLIRGGKHILSSTILAPSENINVPALETSADDFCIQAVLAIVQLRQSESYHRLLSNRANYPFAPCHTYAMDGRARCLPSLQSQIITNYYETLHRLNPNALVTWHSMCMTLTADIQIFDLAAGRAGPSPARNALDNIREWSQTPAARRACLHAAHIYKVMANRKTSDHPTFQSMFSLFSAGLVLGLYTFMVSDSASSPSSVGSVELMDDVDWRSVGTEGFTSFMEPRGSQTFAPTDDPAVNFIRNGATIYLRGLPFHGGYQSARRILLDYASLLKDSGKWSVKKFSYILYIMSDVLMDVE